MKNRLFGLLALAGLAVAGPSVAQREMVTLDGPPKRGFEGIFTLGINGSQIDGDGLSGFNMPGFYLGAAAQFHIDDQWAIGPEFLFSQKGARTTIDDEGVRYIPHVRTRLHYAEFPVLAYFRPTTLRTFSFHAGPSIGYLISGNGESGGIYGYDITPFYTRLDVSAIGGFEVYLNEWLSGMARWTYSLLPTNSNYTDPNFTQIAIQGAGLRNNTISIALRFNLSRLGQR